MIEPAWDRGMEGEVNNHVFPRSAMNTRQEPLLGQYAGSITVDYDVEMTVASVVM